MCDLEMRNPTRDFCSRGQQACLVANVALEVTHSPVFSAQKRPIPQNLHELSNVCDQCVYYVPGNLKEVN
jgi:hypothetical protein